MPLHIEGGFVQLAVLLHGLRHSQKTIAYMLGMTQGAVSKILYRHRETSDTGSWPHSGHPQVTTDREDLFLARMQLRSCFQFAPLFGLSGRLWPEGFPQWEPFDGDLQALLSMVPDQWGFLPWPEITAGHTRDGAMTSELASWTLVPLYVCRWVLSHSVLPWRSMTSAEEARRKTAWWLCKRNS